MGRVLVTWATRHGSTGEIGRAIAGVLVAEGLTVEAMPVEQVGSPLSYDAYVIGSAVYFGRWLPAARGFVDEHRELIASRPTWLFSSGPVAGTGTFDPAKVLAQTGARGHRLFRGRLTPASLSVKERAVAKLLHVGEHDERSWGEVVNWATGVAREICAEDPATPRTAPEPA